jgi:hypothetical protein
LRNPQPVLQAALAEGSKSAGTPSRAAPGRAGSRLPGSPASDGFTSAGQQVAEQQPAGPFALPAGGGPAACAGFPGTRAAAAAGRHTGRPPGHGRAVLAVAAAQRRWLRCWAAAGDDAVWSCRLSADWSWAALARTAGAAAGVPGRLPAAGQPAFQPACCAAWRDAAARGFALGLGSRCCCCSG